MKIVVIGGTGLIGSKTVAILREGGHEVLAASPNTGVNSITGEGLKEAMAGTQVVIDLANSPSFEDKAVLEFFETSGRNLHAAEAAAGVRHHIALSIVGTDRTPDNGYFRAKVAQEKLIETSGIPYTIIRSTQFLEFLGAIAASSADGNMVRLSPGLFQPIAADDVAAIVADVALAAPRNGIVEIAGPERAPFNEIVARYLKAVGDPREVVSDPEARYWGGRVEERSLVPLGEARLGRIGFDEWLPHRDVHCMVRQREFIFYDSGYHRASPDAGAKAISHRAGLQDVGQLLALALRDSGRTAGAVSFQNSLHPINLPALQPQANIRAMNFKDISNFGSGSALHIESHGVKPVSHPIRTIAQGLLAELNQLLNFLGSSTDLYRSHATSCLSVTCYMMSCYLCNPIYQAFVA
jgi:uncharacterized protein YbjT (DUF2867 family)